MKHDLPKLAMCPWGGLLLKNFVSLNNIFFSLQFSSRKRLRQFQIIVSVSYYVDPLFPLRESRNGSRWQSPSHVRIRQLQAPEFDEQDRLVDAPVERVRQTKLCKWS